MRVEFIEELWENDPEKYSGESKSYCCDDIDDTGTDEQIIKRIEKAIQYRRKVKAIRKSGIEIKAILFSPW
ncbi:MAG: hypothetical protein EOP45_21965, partial [Sphingobacteriaceae bacterium]